MTDDQGLTRCSARLPSKRNKQRKRRVEFPLVPITHKPRHEHHKHNAKR